MRPGLFVLFVAPQTPGERSALLARRISGGALSRLPTGRNPLEETKKTKLFGLLKSPSIAGRVRPHPWLGLTAGALRALLKPKRRAFFGFRDCVSMG